METDQQVKSRKRSGKVQEDDRFSGQRKNRDLELVTMPMPTMTMMMATMPMMMATMEEWKTW